jgi:hypothetical protein
MSEHDHHRGLKVTGTFPAVPGNPLYEAAVKAIGFDEVVARRVLVVVVNAIGSYPDLLSPEELGVCLPEVERKLRELAPARADDAMRALQHLLIGWAPSTS